jgi:hypothetical protein
MAVFIYFVAGRIFVPCLANITTTTRVVFWPPLLYFSSVSYHLIVTCLGFVVARKMSVAPLFVYTLGGGGGGRTTTEVERWR